MDSSVSPAHTASSSSALAWPDAIRRERWDDAARGLDSLSANEKAKPEVRYARGRVAIARSEYAEASKQLDALEGLLPDLASEIVRYRSEAYFKVGPYGDAADYFASFAQAKWQLKACEAYEKANLHVLALKACNRAISAAATERSRDKEADARARRMRLDPSQAPTDARWLLLHAPASKSASDIDLQRIDPAHPLTGLELMNRAESFADAGRVDDALSTIKSAQFAPSPTPTALERMRAEGNILYRTSRYAEAASVLSECSKAGGAHAVEDAFRAARAMSRADRDDEAIDAYAKLVRMYPHSSFAPEASFLLARLHLLHGRWREASRAFDSHSTHFASRASKSDVLRGRALAHLMNGDHTLARTLFEKLAKVENHAEQAARATAMSALAASLGGDNVRAISRWTEVARSYPLSWASLVSRARLAALKAPRPPLIEPASAFATEANGVDTDVSLPYPVDLLHRIGLDDDAEEALRARESLITARDPKRSVAILCDAYGKLGRAKRRYQIASRIPYSLLATAPSASTRWAWECAYPFPYADHVESIEQSDSLSEGLIYSVMRQESGFNREAVSPARAVGLLQLLPETAKTVAEQAALAHDEFRLTSPSYNITLGGHYLRELLGQFNKNMPLAIGAYNCGPESIARWLKRSPGMPLDVFVERIPYAETRTYVGRVVSNWARYNYLQKGESGVSELNLEFASAE